MPLYECVFIARQDISTAQVETLTDQFKSIIEERGGAVRKHEYWGLRSLAYKIRKNRKGHYVLFGLDAPTDAVKEVERTMGLNEDVLRYLTLRLDEIDEEPSPLMRSRHGRDDGPRGRGPRGRDGGDRRDGDRRDSGRRDGSAEKARAGADAAPEKSNGEDK